MLFLMFFPKVFNSIQSITKEHQPHILAGLALSRSQSSFINSHLMSDEKEKNGITYFFIWRHLVWWIAEFSIPLYLFLALPASMHGLRTRTNVQLLVLLVLNDIFLLLLFDLMKPTMHTHSATRRYLYNYELFIFNTMEQIQSGKKWRNKIEWCSIASVLVVK